MKTVIVGNDYAVAPKRLWALVTDYAALREVMQGIASFDGLPDGRCQTGQKLEVMVSLFGKLPAQPYFMELLEVNDDKMIMRSSEKGAGVKSWNHMLTVQKTQTGCRLTDHIEIDAGLMTPVFALWARYLYNARHKPRLRILQSGRF